MRRENIAVIVASALLTHCLFIPYSFAENSRRALFVSVIQEPQVLSSSDEIDKLIEYSKEAGINVLFVQVYFGGMSWFPSEIADPEPYNRCLKSCGEDPLALLIRKAHGAGIEVHAWMNMLSLGQNKDAPLLKKYGPEILTRNLKKKSSLSDYKIDDQFFLEPGDPRVARDLIKLVEEVLTVYPELNGVQFDYIRYPDMEPFYGYTEVNMERFKKSTGWSEIDDESSAWKGWKRNQVTMLVTEFTSKARSMRPGIVVSATGCMPYSRAYLEAYQDWPSWVNSGLIDYVTVMSYSPDPAEFESTIVKAKAKTTDFSKVNIAIGAYKLIEEPEKFEREFRITESLSPGGFAVFHYGNLVEAGGLGRFLISDHEKSSADNSKFARVN